MNTDELEKMPCYMVKKALFDLDENPYKSMSSYLKKRGRPTNAERKRREDYKKWELENRIMPKYGVMAALLNKSNRDL